MNKFLIIVVLCLPVFGQSMYSGRDRSSGSVSFATSGCGPGTGYACFVQDANIHNFSVPGPSWGPNTCDWTSPATVSNCGNLTGANTIRTPADFGNAMIRCTDTNTYPGHANLIWTGYDSPNVNAWNVDDTALLIKSPSNNNQYVMGFNPSTLTCSLLYNAGAPVSFGGSAWFSHSVNNVVYAYDANNQTQLMQNTVNLSTGVVTPSLVYDFNSPTCLANPINGTGSSFPEGSSYWTGTGASSLDDSTFTMAFSTLTAQGTGIYLATWTQGQAGCDLWNTSTNVITHNGVLVGTVSDAPWGGANGGKFDKMKMHAALQTPNPNWVTTTASPGTMIYGSYNDGNYFWQKGTTNVQRCGIGASNWVAANAYNDGDRVNPSIAQGNAGDYMYQIVNGVSGTSSAGPVTWNQTPGSDTTDGPLTWHNVGLAGFYPTGAQFFCDGHGWSGYLGLAPGNSVTYHLYANPINPETHLMTSTIACDQHYGNTNGNTTDSAWPFMMTAAVGTGVHLLDPSTPYPSALYDELAFISPPYNSDGSVNNTRAFRRAAHTYNSGWHPTFDTQNALGVVSQTGKFLMFGTDGMGQFGNIDGVSASCNVGAPDWVKNATGDGTTTYAVGYNMLPNPSMRPNVGAYIFQIQSCSAACNTGTTSPTFPQTSGATVVDGTITWVNTGLKQNCRGDVVVVKLTR